MADTTWIENLTTTAALLIALEVRALLARRYPLAERRRDNGESDE